MYKEVFNNNFSAMGTRFGIVLPEISIAHGELVTQLIKDEIDRLENNISRYINSSKVSFLNKYAGRSPAAVDDELFELLKRCKEYNGLTFGAFDITLKPIADYWNRLELENEAPNNGILSSLVDQCGMDKIELIEENRLVFFKNSNLQIDFGAVGKGFALEKVKEILSDNGIENAFISFGESSILTYGKHPNGDKWKIGIPSELNRNENVYVLEVNDCSISTSGNTVNNRIAGRVNIINPFTGYPVKEKKSILAANPDPVLAEVLSTSLMVLPDDRIKSVLSGFQDASAVRIEYEGNEPVITELNKKLLHTDR